MNGLLSRWIMADLPNASSCLQRSLNLPPVIARVLANRGLSEPQEAELFLHGSWDNAPSPFLFADMTRCLNRLEEAIERKEKILIFGDYDADGILALVMLHRALSSFGAHLDYYVPDRIKEGYGIKESHLSLIQQRGAKVVITVDCGIKANNFVRLAKQANIDVIITDHHQPGEEKPAALAILNPQLTDSGYPFNHLTGVGVTFKLIQAFFHKKGKPDLIPHYTKLVAIGTITDVAPLVGENRLLVRHGLKTLLETRSQGLKSLLEVSGLQGGKITEWDVGFRLGPRINAAGRMASADLAVNLFLTEFQEEALAISEKLNQLNLQRQQAEEKALDQALARIEAGHWKERYRLFIMGCEEWHRGIIGIVAARLKEQFHRPVILFSYANDKAYGSGRSIPAFSLIQALRQCSDVFEEFGGHPHAAGCILRREKMPEFREKLNSLAFASLTEDDLRPTLVIDSPLRFSEISKSFLENYLLLPPFGPGNPRPLFLFSGVKVSSKPQFFSYNFAKMSLEQDNRVFAASLFQPADLIASVHEGARLNVVATLQVARFREEETFVLIIEDWAQAK